MKSKIYPLLLCMLAMAACNSNEKMNAINAEVVEKHAFPSLDLLLKNEKIKVGELQKDTLVRTIQCTGQIDIPPTGISSVHSKISGQITYLKYLPGDYVKKGALLTRIEQPQLVEKQRNLLETKANLDFSRKDFERKGMLKAGNATSEKVFDESQSNFELLQATYTGLKKEMEMLGINTNALETDGEFQTSINIYAPQSGYIQEVLVNKGEMVNPTTQLMKITNVNKLHLELQVLSNDIGAIAIGQKVYFTIPNRLERFFAIIIKINPMLHSETATLQVHCEIEHANKQIFIAGMFVNAEIEVAAEEVVGLQLDAVLKEGEKYFAFKVADNQVHKTALINPSVTDNFIIFENEKSGKWITAGAYYIE